MWRKRTLAIMLAASIGLCMFVGLASAAGNDPFTQIMNSLLGIETTVADSVENSIVFYQNGVVLQPSGEEGSRIDYRVLEYEEGKTYHVHMTGLIGSINNVGFYISAGPERYISMTMYHLEGPGQENVNLDFVCNWLTITLINREAVAKNAIAIFTIHYQNSTNVVNMP